MVRSASISASVTPNSWVSSRYLEHSHHFFVAAQVVVGAGHSHGLCEILVLSEVLFEAVLLPLFGRQRFVECIENVEFPLVRSAAGEPPFFEHIGFCLIAFDGLGVAVDEDVDVLAEPAAVVVVHGLRVAESREHSVAVDDLVNGGYPRFDGARLWLLVVAKDDEVEAVERCFRLATARLARHADGQLAGRCVVVDYFVHRTERHGVDVRRDFLHDEERVLEVLLVLELLLQRVLALEETVRVDRHQRVAAVGVDFVGFVAHLQTAGDFRLVHVLEQQQVFDWEPLVVPERYLRDREHVRLVALSHELRAVVELDLEELFGQRLLHQLAGKVPEVAFVLGVDYRHPDLGASLTRDYLGAALS